MSDDDGRHHGHDDTTDPATPDSLLNAYLDGELDPVDRAVVEAHLASSAEARQELEALRSVRVSVRSLGPVEPPAGFLEQLLREGAADVGGTTGAGLDAPPRLRSVPSPTAATDERAGSTPAPEGAGATAAVAPAPFERAGARARRGSGRTPMFGRVAAAVAVAAAAVVLLLGITPVTDAVTPPVQAYAARHDQMVASPPLPGADPASTTSTAPPTTEAPIGTATTAAPTSSTAVPGASEAQAMAFAPMPPAALETVEQPFMAPAALGGGTLARMAAYRSAADASGDGGVLHLMYTDGTAVISVYEQAGAVRWDELPAGTSMTIGGDPARALRSGGDEVIVVARGPIVYTIVATAPHDMTMDMVEELPRPAEPSMTERAEAACRSTVGRFALGD